MDIAAKIAELGLELPKPAAPVAAYAVSYTHLTLPTICSV